MAVPSRLCIQRRFRLQRKLRTGLCAECDAPGFGPSRPGGGIASRELVYEKTSS